MKKTFLVWGLVLALMFGVGFGFPAEKAFAEASAQEPSDSFTADGSVIFEKDGVTVTTAGLDTDPTDGDDQPIVWIKVENTGDQDAFLGVSGGSVNDFMMDILLVDFHGDTSGAAEVDYTTSITVPAKSSGTYALSYYKANAPGTNILTLGKLELCFTLAKDEFSWPDFSSDPVTIVTGKEPEDVDIASLGTAVIDDDRLLFVVGAQDYDSWFGPLVYVYAENRTGNTLGISADSAEADGHACDYMYYYDLIAPGKRSANVIAFEGEVKDLKGFEKLVLSLSLTEGKTAEDLSAQKSEALEPVSVQFPPQVWGEYENGGLNLEIQPKYNELVTVETPADDAKGILFTVSETASMEAGQHDGAGWLFSIGKISEERLHEMLCSDMSGAIVFAADDSGSYYVYYHPTDVRFERATVEQMKADSAQWTMLCEWADSVPDRFTEQNGLEYAAFGNSEIDMAVARAAYQADTKATLSTTEFGPVPVAGVDGVPYAEFVMSGWFCYAEDGAEAPDGEYVVLNFPDEEVRVDFFFAPGAWARVVSGDRETLYQAAWYDEELSYAEAMQQWYYKAAEKAGLVHREEQTPVSEAGADPAQEDAGQLSPETLRDQVLLPALSYHPGTAGSSLAAANASAAILDFAAKNNLRLSGTEDANRNMTDAVALLSEEERTNLSETMPGIIALIDETLETWPENSGLYDDAGSSDLIKAALQHPDAAKDWEVVKAALLAAGIPAEIPAA